MRMAVVVGLSLLSGFAAAQTQPSSPVGIVDDPCGPPLSAPAALERTTAAFVEPGKFDQSALAKVSEQPEVAAYNKARNDRVARDWPNLCRYRDDNAAVLASRAPTRVVFLGDSITELWVKADPALFTNGIVGRGIGGQTTPQMLVRFHADVVALHPRIVHILAGTNDVAGNTGPTTAQDYKNNIVAMTEIAKANNIKVILGSIPPAARFFWRPEVAPVARIAELNQWLRDYAKTSGAEFVDYYAGLAGKNGELRPELANDGVHPNKSGYAIMRPLAQAAIDRQAR